MSKYEDTLKNSCLIDCDHSFEKLPVNFSWFPSNRVQGSNLVSLVELCRSEIIRFFFLVVVVVWCVKQNEG